MRMRREQRACSMGSPFTPKWLLFHLCFLKNSLQKDTRRTTISVSTLHASQCCGNTWFSGDFRVCIFPAVIVFIKLKRKEKEKRRKNRTRTPKGGSFQLWSLSSLLRGHVCQRLNKERKGKQFIRLRARALKPENWREGEKVMAATYSGAFWPGPDDTVYRGQV